MEAESNIDLTNSFKIHKFEKILIECKFMSKIKRKSLRRVDYGDVVVADGVEADYLQLVVYALHLHVL